jgi:hypothetical protein
MGWIEFDAIWLVRADFADITKRCQANPRDPEQRPVQE